MRFSQETAWLVGMRIEVFLIRHDRRWDMVTGNPKRIFDEPENKSRQQRGRGGRSHFSTPISNKECPIKKEGKRRNKEKSRKPRAFVEEPPQILAY